MTETGIKMAPLTKWLMGSMFAIIMALTAVVWNDKASTDTELKDSVKDLTTQVTSLASSTTELSAILQGVVVPMTEDLKAEVEHLTDDVAEMNVTVLKAERNELDLVALEKELEIKTDDRYTAKEASRYAERVNKEFESIRVERSQYTARVEDDLQQVLSKLAEVERQLEDLRQ